MPMLFLLRIEPIVQFKSSIISVTMFMLINMYIDTIYRGSNNRIRHCRTVSKLRFEVACDMCLFASGPRVSIHDRHLNSHLLLAPGRRCQPQQARLRRA